MRTRHLARAGAGHVVKITSKASADSPIARRRAQTEIEKGLIASGLGYTLLRNNAYTQNFLMLAPRSPGRAASAPPQAMINVGVPESVAEMNAQALSPFALGDSDWITDDVPSLLGRPARTFEQFATDHAAAFSCSLSSRVSIFLLWIVEYA
jgi:uncharacterized protein YbjT (DUF2867 family)